MAIIEWGPHFLTGLTEVDRQHQGLVALANRLSEVAADSPEQIDDAFLQLAAYAKGHFALEERLMTESGMAAEAFAAHHKAHEAFIADVSAMWQARDKEPKMTKRILDFLTVWIYKHILITDREMARDLHLRSHSKPPENHFYLGKTTSGASE
jgi:hemerythrin-like metal-binding protein